MNVAQIVAAVTIAFQGLIYFQTHPDQSKHAAILNAQHHHDRGIAIWPHADKKKAKRVNLEDGDVVTFQNGDLSGAQGKITHGPNYTAHVPDLSSLLVSGELDPAVKDEKPHEAVFAYVTLPAGTLTPYGSLPHAVQLSKCDGKASQSYCFAKWVVLTTASSPAKLVVTHATKHGKRAMVEEYSLNADDLILVVNPSSDNKHLHLPAYAELLTNRGQFGLITLIPGDCDGKVNTKPPRTVRFAPAIETILDEFRSPNGDCGPTGP